MPSIFASRRASESLDPMPVPDDLHMRHKRSSMDIHHFEKRDSGPPVSASAKLKSFLGKGNKGDGDDAKRESIRKRLSSPSSFFTKTPSEDPVLSTEAADRYQDLAPRYDDRPFPSPTLFPENFSLSTTASPEAPFPRRGSASWQPSYPTVLNGDDSSGQAGIGIPSIPVASENAQRRTSGLLNTPSPEELSAWPAMEPATKIRTPPQTQAPLPTPPPSAIPQGRSSESISPSSAHKPSLIMNLPPNGYLFGDLTQPAPSSPTPGPVTPSAALPRSRPDMPARRTTLIQSPPMPQPIKNLPTLTGWQGSSREGPTTPGWGALAREGGPKTPGGLQPGGPKTPGWGMLSAGPKTPGLAGFPFSTSSVTTNQSKEKKAMSEDELRRAKRAMPVMLREPSFRLPETDGGDAGDSSESDDSETEMEGGHDDSEGETETERASAAKIRKPFLSKLAGKGKGKAGAAPSPLATSAVPEEDDSISPTSSRTSGTPPVQAKSFWSLPTPSQRQSTSAEQGSWMQFKSSSPAGTPTRSLPPKRAPMSIRTHSTIDSIRSYGTGYFDSMPASTLGTPCHLEPVLARGSGLELEASAQATGLGTLGDNATTSEHIEPHENGYDEEVGNDSDGSGGSGGMSSANHASSSPTAHPVTPIRPRPSQRPSLYSRASQSMVDLSTQPERKMDADLTRREDKASAAPQLETIRSREATPNRIELPPRTLAIPNGMMSPGTEWAKPPPTPAAGLGGFSWGKAKAEEKPTPKRRRSADDMHAPPPEYEPPFPGTFIPRPRDEEGKEKLPKYWCAVHIEGNIQRKMEFTSPGVQARDRSWKKFYCILRGTQMTLYKFDPHRYSIKENSTPVPTVSEADSEEHLHVHVPGERRPSLPPPPPVAPAVAAARRESLGDTSSARRAGTGPVAPENSRRASVSSSHGTVSSTASSEKDASLFPAPGNRRASMSTPATSVPSGSSAGPSPLVSHFQSNQIIKQYTLQNSESGLAADYLKKKNVVRVRAEGEQFLLQTENARDVVDWIEAFQAATNVALDLDDRPMPKIITLPRRRRRRPAPGAVVDGGANPSLADTPEGNAAAVRAAEAADRDRERMLAEDQSRGET